MGVCQKHGEDPRGVLKNGGYQDLVGDNQRRQQDGVLRDYWGMGDLLRNWHRHELLWLHRHHSRVRGREHVHWLEMHHLHLWRHLLRIHLLLREHHGLRHRHLYNWSDASSSLLNCDIYFVQIFICHESWDEILHLCVSHDV